MFAAAWKIRVTGFARWSSAKPETRHRHSIAQITEAAAVIQTHDVIRVRVRENHRVEPVDFFAQALDAEFRRRVHDDFYPVRRDINGRPRAPVFGVRQKFRRIFLADERHALRRAAAEKCEFKRHAPWKLAEP